MRPLRSVVRIVALANLAYFGIEFAVALSIASVSLFADSMDFLEDASVNFLILLALRWSDRTRARIGMLLAALLLAPSIATLWTAIDKFFVPVPPQPLPLSVTGAGALAVNLGCALLLARYKDHRGSLFRCTGPAKRDHPQDLVARALVGHDRLDQRRIGEAGYDDVRVAVVVLRARVEKPVHECRLRLGRRVMLREGRMGQHAPTMCGKSQTPNPNQLLNFQESKIQRRLTGCERCVRRSEQSSESGLEFDV